MSKTRSVLGKGLSALIPGASEEDARYSGIELADSPTERREHTPRIAEIEIARVAPNPLRRVPVFLESEKMKFFLAFILLSFFTGTAAAQWTELDSFDIYQRGFGMAGLPITCIYFLPGTPKVGFVGSETELDKTTDGGQTWYPVWDTGGYVLGIYVCDICFKDSMNGWFAIADPAGDPGPVLFRTSDAGDTWQVVQVPHAFYGAESMYYNKASNLLFIDAADTTGPDDFSCTLEVSSDYGGHWNSILNLAIQGFSFSSDSVGIASATPNTGDSCGIIRTTDAGRTWSFIFTSDSFNFYQPLSIPGTSICFACTRIWTIIYRSDDYGQTWRVVKDFGPIQDAQFRTIAPASTGCIAGDLSRLYIQTDTGMFLSTDSGSTWLFDAGPALSGFNNKFYCTHGHTFAGAIGQDTFMGYPSVVFGKGLWGEIWPQSGVAEPKTSSGDIRIFPNPAANDLEIESGPSGTARLFDVLGREVLDANDDGTGTTLDVSHLVAGTYFLRMGTQSAKIVVAH